MTKPNIPGYDVLDKIADGGMSTVWKANQTSLDRLVALKVLNRGVVKTDEDVRLFKQEAKAAARLHAPGLCQIYDAGEHEGTVYYAMEYIAGLSVGRMIVTKGDIPEKQALKIADGVAQILLTIWDKYKVIHCDIKPDNILIDEEGAVRITDFGVARFIGSMAQQSDRDYFVGTPNYTSPEQAEGLETLDCRTDMYGLGATLYHMITGLLPFASAVGVQAMELHHTGYLAAPQSIHPQLGDPVVALVEKLMVKDRARRYPTWSAVIQDIEAVVAGRLPKGDIVPEGLSTVKRTAGREQSMQRTLTQQKSSGKSNKPFRVSPKDTVDGEQVPRLKLTVPSEGKTGSREPPLATARRTAVTRESGMGAAAKTGILALIVTAVYWLVFAWDGPGTRADTPETASAPIETSTRSTPPPTRTPDASSDTGERRALTAAEIRARTDAPAPQAQTRRTTQREQRSAPAPTRQTPQTTPRETPPAEPRQADRRPTTNEPWDHPDYVEAMKLLRAADAALQQFLRDRDRALLENIEPDCRKAIALLEALRDEAPARAQVAERIRQGYQIISNSRRMR